LKETLDETNKRFNSTLFAPFMITRGDKFAAVFTSVKESFDMTEHLRLRIQPVKVRFGIGMGELTAGLESHLACEIDGPAFYRAGDALEQARRKRRFMVYQTGQELFDRPLNALCHLVRLIQDGWTLRQQEVVGLYQGGLTQREVAQQLGITQQAVADALQKAHWEAYSEAADTIRWLLGRIE